MKARSEIACFAAAHSRSLLFFSRGCDVPRLRAVQPRFALVLHNHRVAEHLFRNRSNFFLFVSREEEVADAVAPEEFAG